MEVKGWSKATNLIQKYVQSFVENEVDVDVAFIGDGLIERLNGIVLGIYSEQLETVHKIYKQKEEKSKVEAAVLGIAGDGASNLLFRLKEKTSSRWMGVPPGFNPKIWFIHIGIEDFMKGCSEEVVLVGILRVVEELMVIKKNAKIIISPINPIRETAYNIMPHFGNGMPRKERKEAIKDEKKRLIKGTDERKAFKARIKEERMADKEGLADRGVITTEGMHQLLKSG